MDLKIVVISWFGIWVFGYTCITVVLGLGRRSAFRTY